MEKKQGNLRERSLFVCFEETKEQGNVITSLCPDFLGEKKLLDFNHKRLRKRER